MTAALGLLAVVAGLAIAACDKQSACRPGTVFLHIDLGPYTSGVDELDVGVSVDGGIAMHSSLAVTPGMKTGGIEVQFPHGYPAGKPVTIQVAVKAGGIEIANHTVNVTPASGCDVIDTMFTGADAVTGAGGAGGAGGGAGGEAGTLGGGAGTRGTAGTTGGAVGGSVAGGRGGTGRGGSTGRGGTGGACVPIGAENCFNNYDDDCDGNIDCADPDCGPVAQCVPLDPSVGLIGVFVSGSSTSCPAGYASAIPLMNGMNFGDDGCKGCSCRPPSVTCSATIYSFGSATACSTATIAGVPELTFSSTQSCTVPSWVGSTQGTIYGVQASSFMTTVSNGCTPSGTPALSPITWATSGRFCAASMVGGGCGGAQACVPLVAASRCVLVDGSVNVCPGNTGLSYWYTSVSDGRTCGPCTCGNPSGASCSGLAVSVGSDYSCSMVTQSVGPSQRKCYGTTGVNSPGIVFTGAPTTPTCAAVSNVLGGASPAGAKTLCCQ